MKEGRDWWVAAAGREEGRMGVGALMEDRTCPLWPQSDGDDGSYQSHTHTRRNTNVELKRRSKDTFDFNYFEFRFYLLNFANAGFALILKCILKLCPAMNRQAAQGLILPSP